MEREDRPAWKDGVCVWRGGVAGGDRKADKEQRKAG